MALSQRAGRLLQSPSGGGESLPKKSSRDGPDLHLLMFSKALVGPRLKISSEEAPLFMISSLLSSLDPEDFIFGLEQLLLVLTTEAEQRHD